MYHLLKNPEIYHKAQAEVDQVVGNDALELKHISQLKYLEACLRETLRFQGPINVIVVTPKADTVIGSKYRVKKGTGILFNLAGFHHDPKVWGDDAELFKPERFLDGKSEALPPNAFKPFGNGMRACIGRAFAEQEMLLATAMVLQRFQAEFVDPSYNLGMHSTSETSLELFLLY
jgi:cytochrome P450/NADPH-cytochrome P450 reductase